MIYDRRLKLRTREDLEIKLEAEKEKRNGRGFIEYVYMKTGVNEYGRKYTQKERANAFNVKRITIARWDKVYDGGGE